MRGLALGLAVALHAGGAAASGALHVDGRFFRDAAGGAVLLRGVNVALDAKVPPFAAVTQAAQLDPLEAWGLNAIRLLFVWEAYEPAPGVYDTAYLDQLESVADWAWERGLHVIVDVHQDGFSRHSIGGCGSGFPVWAIPFPVIPDPPDNGPGCAGWVAAMPLDLDMHYSWNRFYADAAGVRTRYLDMLALLAQRFAGHPGVVGYDLLNEPWGDELGEIGPLYEDGAARVRQHHPDAILFVSPHALTTVGTQTSLAEPSFGNYAYAPHYYDVTVNTLGIWSGVPPDLPFAVMAAKAAEWDVPLLLGEFGAPATTVQGLAFVDALYARLDQHLASGTQWGFTPNWNPQDGDGWNGEDFSLTDEAGALRGAFRIRPYARRVSGTPLSTQAEASGAVGQRFLELTWQHDPSTGSTELYVPRQELFGNRTVMFELEGDGLACAFEAGAVRVICTSDSPGIKSVRVSARPRACGLLGAEVLLVLVALRARKGARRSDAARPRRRRASSKWACSWNRGGIGFAGQGRAESHLQRCGIPRRHSLAAAGLEALARGPGGPRVSAPAGAHPQARHSPDVEHVEVSSTHVGLGFDPDVYEIVARRLAGDGDD